MNLLAKKQFPVLVFDWDGTLMDSTASIAQAIHDAFHDVGVSAPSVSEARHVIGLGLDDAMAALAPTLDAATCHQVAMVYRARYFGQSRALVLFDGVREALAAYQAAGYRLAVATGKSRRGLDEALLVSGLVDFFDITRCAEETQSKPHPQMLHEIAEILWCEPAQMLMVGDTTHDITMAHAAGVAGLAIAQGAHDPEVLRASRPLVCVNTFLEADAWIRQHS